MENKDYGEIFCQAVDEIITQRLESVKFDSTILCTIVDDTYKDTGRYTVTNNGGLTKFDAFSSNTDYRNNNNVYVQIPNGDWDQQKIIIAKKTDKTDEPYVYNKPFSSLVDITGNLINSNINSTQTGLIANHDVEKVILWTYNANSDNAIINAEGEAYSSYTRLGISAGFQSWLNPFYIYSEETEIASEPRYIIEGDYGLCLEIITEQEETSTATEKQTIYQLYLNCADMNGNPYEFASFYSQEKVFDISALDKIVSMQLSFYQKSGTFKDREGNLIPAKDFLGNIIKPNLYANDIYISLGYDINEFSDEMVKIYTLDSTTFTATADPLISNHKQIQLRWIHKMEDGSFKSIRNKDDIGNYEVRWYRYSLGSSSADEYSGVYWKNLSNQITEGKTSEYSVLDSDWDLYNKTCAAGEKRDPGFFTTWSLPDTTLQEEQYKAIILYNGIPYRSNTLVFTNEKEVVSKPTVDAVQALSIVCEDSTYGNYRIYNQGNSLLDFSQSAVVRTWTPYFKSATGNVDSTATPLVEAESIEWIIPTKKTMIIIDDSFKGDNFTYDEDERIHIIRYGAGIKGNELTNRNTQQYRVRGYYSQAYSDNTIQCKIIKDKITYTATKEMTFGVAGTTGTDCTFILDFDNGVTAVTNSNNDAVTITARLYDYENNEIDISDKDIEWSWKIEETDTERLFDISTTGFPTYQCEIKRNSNILKSNRSNFSILQAKLTEWGDYDLIAYLPIPLRSKNTYNYISGTTQIIYNSDGELTDYFKNPYVLYQNTEVVEGVTWTCINGISGEKNYTPSLTSNKDGDYYLTPLSFYVEGACEKICVVGKIGSNYWSQPVLIMSNRYPSAMINEWDGSLDLGSLDKGTVLAPRLAAGKKESDNSFSGVMLGDWSGTDSDGSLTTLTGLYGYDSGEQTFAFRQNGTAYIGKSGAGRIEFNGSEGIIEASSYSAGKGMSINLAAGTINAHQFTLTAGKSSSNNYLDTITAGNDRTIIINTEAKVDDSNDYPFSIGSKFKVDWNGSITASDGNFTGVITATEGYIGPWKINKSGLISESGDVYLYADGELLMGSGRGQIYLGNGTLEIGNRKSWNKITINSDEGITIGEDSGTYKATFIDSNGICVNNVSIYSQASSKAGLAGHLKYVESNYATEIGTGVPGIGIESSNGLYVLKVTNQHIGATNGSVTWVLDGGGFKASYGGSTNNPYVHVRSDSVWIKNLTVEGNCVGIYATLA